MLYCNIYCKYIKLFRKICAFRLWVAWQWSRPFTHFISKQQFLQVAGFTQLVHKIAPDLGINNPAAIPFGHQYPSVMFFSTCNLPFWPQFSLWAFTVNIGKVTLLTICSARVHVDRAGGWYCSAVCPKRNSQKHPNIAHAIGINLSATYRAHVVKTLRASWILLHAPSINQNPTQRVPNSGFSARFQLWA